MLTPSFFHFICDNRTIFDTVLAASCPTTIARFSITSRQAHAAAKSFNLRAFDIDRHLLRFFDSPLSFRRLQQLTGLVISGSNALQFMARIEYPGSDLDMYVDARYGGIVGEWLLSHGHTFRPMRMQPNTFSVAVERSICSPPTLDAVAAPHVPSVNDEYSHMRGIHNVYTFVGKSRGVDTKVQLITANRSPMEVIMQFHSTCVMNVISHANAYSFYPRATFIKCESLVVYNPRDSVPALAAARSKWSTRGWTMVHLDDANMSIADATFSEGRRWIGDTDTWCIPLNTRGLDPGLPRCDYLSIHSWKLRHSLHNTAAMKFLVVSSRALCFRYLISGVHDIMYPLLHDALELMEKHNMSDDHVVPQSFRDADLARLYNANRRYTVHYTDLLASLQP